MKKFLSVILIFLMIFSVCTTVSVSANTSDWYLSNVLLSHKTIEFSLSGVESAQTATVVLTEEDTENSISLNFEITSPVQDFKLTIPDDQCLKSGCYYDVYVLEESGLKTSTKYSYFKCDLFSLYSLANYSTAYPCMFDFEVTPWANNSCLEDYDVDIQIDFEKYACEKTETGFACSYPKQELDTNIIVHVSDKYGCSTSFTDTISSSYGYYSYISSYELSVYGSGIFQNYNNFLDVDERLCAKIGENVYYSEYSTGENYTEQNTKLISYPSQKHGTEITLWLENKNGSVSKETTDSIDKCDLYDFKYNLTVYPALIKGSFAKGTYEQIPVEIKATIGKIVYSCAVAENGTFSLNIPRQKDYTDINIELIDQHGCSYSFEKEVSNSLSYFYLSFEEITLDYLTISCKKDARVGVKFGNSIYYSEYNTSGKENVTITYPRQSPGATFYCWYENKNTERSNIFEESLPTKTAYILLEAKKTTFVSGKISEYEYEDEDDIEYYDEDSMDLTLTSATLTINNYKYTGVIDGVKFSFDLSHKKALVGQTAKITLVDKEGYTFSTTFIFKNIKPKLNITTVTTSSKKITGVTEPKAKVTLKIKGKTYSKIANGKGAFSFKISRCKKGTKFTISIIDANGYTNKKTKKVQLKSGFVLIKKTIYKNSASIPLKLKCEAGDKVKLKIGNKIYKKTIRKKTKSVTFNINKTSAGTKIKVFLYDSFGKFKSSDSSMVYYGDKFFVGMSQHDAELTTWGYPVSKNYYGWITQWVYERGGTTVYLYFRNGKVTDWQILNY